METKEQDHKKFERIANSIVGLVGCLNYEIYTPVEVESLILLTNYIRTIPSEEIAGFRISKLTESHSIFTKLKDGYSTRTIQEAIKELLIEYEHFEILAKLEI